MMLKKKPALATGGVAGNGPRQIGPFPFPLIHSPRMTRGHPEAAAGEWRGGGTGKVVKEQQAPFQQNAAHPELPGVGWPLPKPTAFAGM